MSGNPFVLTFGREPSQYILRTDGFNEIREDFAAILSPIRFT